MILSAPYFFFQIAFLLMGLYIGIKLYKYQHDYVGGLKVLGVAYIIDKFGDVFSLSLAFTSNIFTYKSTLYIITNCLSSIITTALWLYVMYCMCKLFDKAQQYELPAET